MYLYVHSDTNEQEDGEDKNKRGERKDDQRPKI